MAVHLVRAQSTYTDKEICSFHHTHTHTHTHTHYKYMHNWWWVGKMRRKKMTDQYAAEKRWVFSFDLREVSEDKCLTERGIKGEPKQRSITGSTDRNGIKQNIHTHVFRSVSHLVR